MASYFAAALTDLLQTRSQSEIAKISGIGQSTLSLYASGERGISVSALSELAKAFPDRGEWLNLVRAHLLDELPAEAGHEVEIGFRGYVLQEHAGSYDKDLDSTLEVLRAKAKDPDVRAVLFDLRKILQ